MDGKQALHFKTNVQLKSIIGKDLINDDNIAVLELVKNAFDADAKTVNINYVNLKENDDASLAPNMFTSKTSRLIIQDDGVGMNMNDIQNKWLNIAYSEKKTNKNQFNRRMAGAKGVGRFSCDRLGEYLNLYAKTSNDNQYVKLTIDWKLFEVEDEKKEIQTIPLQYTYLSSEELKDDGIDAFKHGVLLEIIKLRSSWAYLTKNKEGETPEWNTDKFSALKRYLEKLINPNQAFEHNDFGVYMYAPEFIMENDRNNDFDKFIGKVENKIFDKLDFKTTNIETFTCDEGQNIYTELKDKGEIVFWIKERNPYFPYIKNVKVTIYFLNQYAKAFFTKQTGMQPVNYGSVFLFINGFRVPPYGDTGNDWLALDQRKAQGTKRYLGTRDIIGQIEIADEKNDFQIVSSREGVVNNESFKNLTSPEKNDSFFYKGLRRLERYVVEGLNWDSSKYDSQNPEESKILREIENKIVAGKTTEEELEYREDAIVKQKRVYSTIHSIISAKSNEVISLYINENLITLKIEEEKQISEKEFQQLIDDFEKKKIDSETLNIILQRKIEQSADLEKQLREFSKYKHIDDATSLALLELKNYQKTVEEQALLIKKLQEELESLKHQKALAEENASSYKKKAERAENELSIEKEKSKYLLATRRTLSPDADGIIHTIKIDNLEIRDGLDNIIDDLTEDAYEIDNIIERLGRLKIHAERSLKMTEYATRADLSRDNEVREVDIVAYIIEYIELYGKTHGNVDFYFKGESEQFYKNVSLLDLSIVIDNMINNATKWGADEILFSFKKESQTKLNLMISDNGAGLSNKFTQNPEQIFELSVRDSPPSKLAGSGIGLYFTRDILKKMNSTIEYTGNRVELSGASFDLMFCK